MYQGKGTYTKEVKACPVSLDDPAGVMQDLL